MRILFLLLLSSVAFALKPHTATYSLSIMGLEIAEEQRQLTQENGVYRYLENAQTTGLAKLIKDYQINAQSNFVIDESGIYSQHYKLFERDGELIKKDIDIQPQKPQIDPLSLFLSLSHGLAQNPKQSDFYFVVNDGKKVEKHHYQQVENKNSNLIKIINPEKHIEAYFAKNKHYLPVIVNKKKFSYKLNEVTFLAPKESK